MKLSYLFLTYTTNIIAKLNVTMKTVLVDMICWLKYPYDVNSMDKDSSTKFKRINV